jgi:hypothetical protein
MNVISTQPRHYAKTEELVIYMRNYGYDPDDADDADEFIEWAMLNMREPTHVDEEEARYLRQIMQQIF